MLVTFTTEAYSDITMFGKAATSLLRMMGQSGNVPGALMAEDIPAALATLRKTLADQIDTGDGAGDTGGDEEGESVSLSTRALPLVKLLEAARDANTNVIWNH